jgi:hypothetical protein
MDLGNLLQVFLGDEGDEFETLRREGRRVEIGSQKHTEVVEETTNRINSHESRRDVIVIRLLRRPQRMPAELPKSKTRAGVPACRRGHDL